MNKPELLCPAGDLERLQMALHFGADAVYLAGAQFGMRAGAENFTPDGIRAAVQLAHAQGAAVHVTCNTLPRDDEMAQLPAYLELLDDAGVDAIIAADLGVITLAKRHAPHVALHVSTQFGVVNSAAAAALYDLGAQRVVLARELSLAEIRTIRANTPPELELEAFVHGAMCVSFSGRCLLSNYLTGRDANRGRCAQPCRWKYGLTEAKRPGQVFDITEDEQGTYIFNSRDMCMIDHLPELLAAFAYGPLAGVAVAAIKNLIHLPLSSSMYVGELSNFLLGAVLSVAAGAIYKKHKTKRGALAAAVLSAVIMGLISVPVNYWIIYPLYYNVLGFPQAAVLDMYQAILPATKSILQALFIFNLPFTVAKGLLCAALCAGIYKPLSPLLHGRK